jgi:hypothetical protein
MVDDSDKNEETTEEAMIETLAEEEALEDTGLEDAPELAEAEAIALEGIDDIPREHKDADDEKADDAKADDAKDDAPVPPAAGDKPADPTKPADDAKKAPEKKVCPLNEHEKIYHACKLVIGTVLAIAGIWVIAEGHVDVEAAQFGADFYTYTYVAIVNVAELLHVVAIALGWLLLGLGTLIDLSVFRPRPHHPHHKHHGEH